MRGKFDPASREIFGTVIGTYRTGILSRSFKPQRLLYVSEGIHWVQFNCQKHLKLISTSSVIALTEETKQKGNYFDRAKTQASHVVEESMHLWFETKRTGFCGIKTGYVKNISNRLSFYSVFFAVVRCSFDSP